MPFWEKRTRIKNLDESQIQIFHLTVRRKYHFIIRPAMKNLTRIIY